MGLSLHSKMHQCLTLFPVLFLQSLYVPFYSDNFSIYLSPLFLYLVPLYLVMILMRSSILVVTGLIKPNNVFVNELFLGAEFDLHIYMYICCTGIAYG